MVIFYIVCLYFPEASRTKRIRVLVYAIEPTAHRGERTAANLGKGATHERVYSIFMHHIVAFLMILVDTVPKNRIINTHNNPCVELHYECG